MLPAPYREVIQIFADEYRRGISYRNWRPHGTNDWILIHTVQGRGRLKSRKGEECLLEPGSCLLYEPGAWQHYETDSRTGRWHLLWARFRPLPQWLPHLDWPEMWAGLRLEYLSDPAVRRAVQREMRHVVDACRSRSPLALEFGLNAMERVLLHICAASQDHLSNRMDARILKALRLLATRLQEPFSISGLATECGISPSHFAHLFRQETGTTPQRMFEENRMRRASQLLLSTGLTVAEIARDIGYENPFYFSNRFRKFWRTSPTAYRTQGEDGRQSERPHVPKNGRLG